MNALQNTKEGDPVAVFCPERPMEHRLAGKCTRTRITVGNQKFMRRHGGMVGGGFSWIEAWTPEHDELLTRQKTAGML